MLLYVELGLGADHDGIMILPDNLETGALPMQELGLVGDVLWDLEINPNRPDAMSIAGVARDSQPLNVHFKYLNGQ